MGSRVSQIRASVGAGNQGRSVGVAMGTIRINTGQLLVDANKTKQIYADLSKSGEQIGVGVSKGAKQAESSLKSLQSTATNTFAALAKGFALPGLIGATQTVKQMEFTIRALAGSQEKANQQFDIMDKLAKRTGQSVLTVQRAALGILPAVNRANVDLEQTLLLAQRLAFFDPAQGAEGAGFALREFMSGSVVSLATRFELPRQELNRILQESQGNTQAMIDGLDALIAKMGITEQTIVDAGEQGITTFARLKDEIILTSAAGFEPFLNNAILPLVEGFGDLMSAARQANPELVEVAGTLAGILATVTALQTVGLGGRGVTGLAAIGAAGFVGVEAGTALARAGAEVGTLDNDRLKNVSQDEAKKVIEESFKQVIVLLVDQLINIAFELVEGAITVENAKNAMEVTFEALKNTFEAGQAILDTSFDNAGIVIENAFDKLSAAVELAALDVEDAFRAVIEALGQFIVDLPGDFGLDKRGRDLIDAARSGASTEAEREALRTRRDQDFTTGTTSLDDAVAEFEAKVKEFENILANLDIGLTDAQKANLEITKQEIRDKIITPIAEGLGLLENKAGSWLDRMREGFAGRTGAAPVAAPEEFTDKMLEAFSKFQKDIADLQKKAGEDRAKANAAAADSQTKALNKRNADIAQLETEGTKRRNEIITKSNRAAEDAEEDHQDSLAEIQRRGMRDVQRAAARFDAQGVFNALEGMEESERVENQSFEKAKGRREEQAALELSELEVANAEKLTAIQDGYKVEKAEIEANRQERLNQINAQLRDELAQRNAAFTETHNRLVAEAREQGNHNVRMLNIQSQGTANLENQYRAWIASMGGYVPQATPQQIQQAAQSVQTAIKPIRIPGFARGTGNTGLGGLAMLHRGEGVMDATTAALMRSVTGSQNPSQAQMRGAISGSSTANTYNVTVPIYGDIGNWSEGQIKSVAKEAFTEVMEALAA